MPPPEIEEMTSTLLALGIGRTAAATYAAQLFEEGYDTPDSLNDISEKEMQELDFKKRHIRMIIKESSHENLKPGEEESERVREQVREAQREREGVY
jgi:hypothetical protein